MIQIGINGFGRIGRVVMRIAAAQPQCFRICGVNLRSADPAYMAYQLKYDSVFGPFPGTIEAAPNALIINGHAVYSESDASRIKWKNCGAEYIVESTGAFNTYYQAALHFAGAAQAVGRVIPKLNSRLTGMAFRVSCNDVSVIDLTARLVKPAGYSEICAVMKEASETYMKDMIGYTTDQVVSADISATTIPVFSTPPPASCWITTLSSASHGMTTNGAIPPSCSILFPICTKWIWRRASSVRLRRRSCCSRISTHRLKKRKKQTHKKSPVSPQ